MKTSIRLLPLFGLTLTSAFAQVEQAIADLDGLFRNYNLISFGSASFTQYGDTEGPLAVAGNLYLDGGSVANIPSKFGVTSDPTLYVGGNLTLNNFTHLNAGYASTPNATGMTWDAQQKRLSGNGGTLSTSNSSDPLASTSPLTNPGPANWDWVTLESQSILISETLAQAQATGIIEVNGQTLNLNANGITSGTVIFEFDADLLVGNKYNGQSISNIQFTVPTDVNFVVNVINANGRTLFGTGTGINFNNGVGYERLLWNIVPETSGTTSVSLGNGGRFYGSVLAPLVNLSNTGNTAVDGQLITANYTHSNNELHYVGFNPAITAVYSPVPEPATWGVIGVVACALALSQRRRRQLGSAVIAA